MAAYATKPGGNASTGSAQVASTGSAQVAATGSAHGYEGKNILEFVGDLEQRPALVHARRKLFEAREKRVRPDRDNVQSARPRQLPVSGSCRIEDWR